MDIHGNPTDTNVHGNSTNTDVWGNPSNVDVHGNPPNDSFGNYDPASGADDGGLFGSILDIFLG